MQTRFTPSQLEDPAIREADGIFRSCVHCGFCQATCPTYVLLGDELDSPRGRIYLIKDMLERDAPPTPEVVTHIDRCLSCLACVTTCPSSVDYMHLVDLARARIERTYTRPWRERLPRWFFAAVLPRPTLTRVALRFGRGARRVRAVFPAAIRAALDLMPARVPTARGQAGTHPARGARRLRVALLQGCVQSVLDPAITDAAIGILTRHGCDVIVSPNASCCGALAHHLGRTRAARRQAIRTLRAWTGAAGDRGFDAFVTTASGCGTMLKDYGHLLSSSARFAAVAKEVAGKSRDITEVLAGLGLDAHAPEPLTVAYHAPCSLRNGQKIDALPRRLLAEAGFAVVEPDEPHLCCGSAGTYNLLQPAIAAELGRRKADALGRTGAAVVAAGNIGCITQIAAYADLPVVHPVSLLDWATGGARPAALGGRVGA